MLSLEGVSILPQEGVDIAQAGMVSGTAKADEE